MTDFDELPSLDQYQTYLLLLARANLVGSGLASLDLNDLVQETLLKAQKSLKQFRGNTNAQLAGWLRSILLNQLTDQLRRSGRELDEQALARRLEQSSARIGELLATKESPPIQHVVCEERIEQLAEALVSLPDDQRQAIEFRHLQEMPLAEIAERMLKTTPAIAGLLQRGLRGLRENVRQLKDESSR